MSSGMHLLDVADATPANQPLGLTLGEVRHVEYQFGIKFDPRRINTLLNRRIVIIPDNWEDTA